MADQDIQKLVAILRAMSGSTTSPQDRREAENTYNDAKKSNPDVLCGSLVRIVQPNNGLGVDEALREFAIVLLRRLFSPDGMNEGEIAFNKCGDQTKQNTVDLLLKQWSGGESGETSESVKIHRLVGNALVTLADQVILPVIVDPNDNSDDQQEKRDEAKWPDLLRTTMVISAGNAFKQQGQESTSETEGQVKIRANGLRILCELLSIYPETIKSLTKDIQTLLESCFLHSDININVEGVELVLHMVMSFKAKEWRSLQPCLSVILRCVEKLAEKKENDLLRGILESMTETCEFDGLAIFFKPEIRNLTELISKIISAREELNVEVRNAALEFLITLSEQKPKMCCQQFASFPAVLLKCTMDCLLEFDHDEQEWCDLMEDEEDDDEDELYKLGCEVIDRAIMAFGMKKFSAPYFEAIGFYNQRGQDKSNPEAWRNTVAALSAVSEGVEYIEEQSQVDSLMQLCLENCTYEQQPHTRVRAQAWHAMSRVFSDHTDATERWCEKYMQATLISIESDPVARIQQKCLGSFLYFGEALDSTEMEVYSQKLLQTLVQKLQNRDCHRGVREESITAIAVVAGSIGKDFGQYYSDIMPFLKEILQSSTIEKETRLRGKAFECMSLLGVAVGRARFREDGAACLQAMLGEKNTVGSTTTNTTVQVEKKNAEVLSDYLKDAVERIAGVLEEDLGPYIGVLLDTFLKPLDLNNLPTVGNNEEDDEDGAIMLASGQKVKSAVFKEMKDSCDVITTLLQNCKQSFFNGNHIPRVCEILINVLKCQDETIRMSLESDDVLEGCSDVWAACIGILAKRDQKLSQDYIVEYCKHQVDHLKSDSDEPEVLSVVSKGIADVLSAACPTSTATAAEKAEFGDTTRYLDSGTLKTLWSMVLSKMEIMIKKREAALLRGSDWGAAEEDVEGEVGNLEVSDDHHEANISLSQIIGSLMQLNKDFFRDNFLAEISGMINFLLDPSKISTAIVPRDRKVIENKNKILAYFITCDLAEYLATDAASIWLEENFLKNLFKDLKNVSCEVRHAACYCVYLISSYDGFKDTPLAGEAFKICLEVIKGGKSLFGKSAQSRYISTEEINMSEDNLSASAFQLLACSPTLSANVSDDDWNTVLSRLPLKTDVEMNQQVISKLIHITHTEPRPDVVGAQQERVGKICGVLAESYKTFGNYHGNENEVSQGSKSSSEEMGELLDKQIRELFSTMPENVIQDQLKSKFSKTQWRKLEKIIIEARGQGVIVN